MIRAGKGLFGAWWLISHFCWLVYSTWCELYSAPDSVAPAWWKLQTGSFRCMALSWIWSSLPSLSWSLRSHDIWMIFFGFFWSCLLLSFPFCSLAAFYWVSSFFLFMPDAICYSFVFCPAHLPGSAMTLGSLFCCIAFSAGMEVGEGSGKVSMIFLRALAFVCSVHWLVWCNVWIFVFVPFVCCLTRTEGSRCANGIRVMDLHTTWGLIVRALESCFLCWRPSGALVAFEHRNWFFKLILTIWWSVWLSTH